jgi:hypothetical protein
MTNLLPRPRAQRLYLCLVLAVGIFRPSSGAQAQPPIGSNLPQPRLMTVSPPGGKVGTTVEVSFTGTDLEEPEKLLFSHAGIKAEPIQPPAPPAPDAAKPAQPMPKQPAQQVTRFKVTIDPGTPLGVHDVRLVNKWGVSNPRAFVVGDLNEVMEKEPNNDVPEAQRVELNTTVNGAMASPIDVDYYVFAGKKGQRVVFSCLASTIDSRFHPAIEVYDATGRLLAFNRNYLYNDALTDLTLPYDGDYHVRVFEFTHTQGTPEHFYRLSITTAPWIDAIHPAVVEPGKATQVSVYGRNLPGGKPDEKAVVNGRVLEKLTVTVTAPADPAAGRRQTFGGRVGPAGAGLDGFEYRLRNDAGSSNPFLLTFAKAPVVVENETNDTGETAQEVSLPCEIAGRIEKKRDRDWYAFTAKKGEVYTVEALSDRLGVGASTLLYFGLYDAKTKQKLYESPENVPEQPIPQFFTHSEDPPQFRFTVPADGKYSLLVASRVGDTLAGPRELYRVRITPEQPDFTLVAMAAENSRPDGVVVPQGGSQAYHVMALRQDGFTGEIALSVEGLPGSVACVPQTLAGTQRVGSLVLSAAPEAAAWTGEIKILGTATVKGEKVVREARSACIVWPVPPQSNLPTVSRLDRNLVFAVRGKAPYQSNTSIDKPALVQGDRGTIKVTLTRLWTDFKQPLLVQAQPLELPPGFVVNNNQPVTIAPNQHEASLPVVVAGNVQPGTYTLVLRTQSQIPFNKDPKAAQKPPTIVVQPTTPVTLTVLPRSVAALTLGNAAPTIKVGTEGELVVKVARQSGYEGDFKVQLVLPPNVKGVEAGESTIPAGQNEVKLVLKVPADAAPGNVPNLTVRATATLDGVPIVHEVKFNVNVVK